MWSNNVENSLMSTTTLYYPLTGGAQSVYGDGGYARIGANCNGGAIGYNFDSGVHKPNSSLGYQTSASNNHQQAVIFTAPRSGYIQPNISLMGNKANVHAWQLYKLDAEGVKTQIYPRVGDETMSLEPTCENANVVDEWKNGWLLMPTTATVYDTEKLWVNEGEKLILRFGGSTTGAQHTGFEIGNLNYTYLAPTSTFEAEYDATQRVVDFRELQTFPETSDFAAATGLTETDVDGVFTVDADFVSGSTVTVTETLGTAVHTLTAKLTRAQYHYDLGDAFLLGESYYNEEKGGWYYPNSLTPKYRNDGTSIWSVGYINYTDGYASDKIHYFDNLTRTGKTTRAYEDPDTTKTAQMMWTSANGAQQNGAFQEDTEGAGWYDENPNGAIGALGYSFGNGSTDTNSATGWCSNNTRDNHKIAKFVAPRDGIVKINFKASSNGTDAVAYRLDKVSGETRTVMMPANGEKTISTIVSSADYAVPAAFQNGWGVLSKNHLGTGTWTEDGACFKVSAGDVLELRFAALATSAPFMLDTFTIDYVQKTASVHYVYDGEDRIVDLRDTILDAEDMMFGASIPESAEIILPVGSPLTATETKGVFTLAESYVDGTPVTVTVQNGWNFLTITADLKVMQMVYDLGEIFKTSNTFTGEATDYTNAGLTPAVGNGEAEWTVGYYTLGNTYGTLTKFKELHRYSPRGRAYEDDTRATLKPLLSWIDYENGGTDENGYYCSDPNGGTGSIGYSFGLIEGNGYEGTSALGWNSSAGSVRNQVVVFKAPRDGVINPAITMTTASTSNNIIYRMDKIAEDGTVTPIYPMAGETTTTWVPHATNSEPAPEAWANGWAVLGCRTVVGWTNLNQALVRVNAGDEIILRFASNISGNSAYAIDSYTMTYHKGVGADDELFLESPLTAYEEEEMVALYPEESVIDLSRELPEKMANGVVPAGTVEYTLSGAEDVLEETALSGVFALTGKLNYGGEAVTVTAGYYSPNKSAANGDAPRFTVSTKVYVRAYSSTVDAFANDDYAVDVSGFGFGDGFFLPYYENETERAIYGTVDLGLTDTWKGATVAFSEDGYFEYLGNGRIRALQKYDYTTAGGNYVTKKVTEDYNPVGGPTAETTNKTVLYNIRGEYTTGTPITMTVTAKDGGVKEYSLWAFPAEVQDSTLGYNSYKLDLAAPLANPVMKLEAYLANGTTHPMYPDSMNNKKAISVDALEPYIATIGNYAPTPYMGIFADGSSTWMLPSAKGTFDAYIAPVGSTYVDYDGVSWTFTAPKSGTISLTDFAAIIQTTQKANYNSDISKNFKSSVRLYANETTTEYTELFNCDYKHETVAFSDFNTVTVGDASVVTYDEETDELVFNVEKGQVVRVLFHSTGTNYNGYATLAAGVLPDPLFTYVPEGNAEVILENNQLKVYVADDTDLIADGVLTLLYDAAGNLVESVKAATIADDYAEVAYTSADADVTYAKLFFWNGLENIQPLGGDILVRK